MDVDTFKRLYGHDSKGLGGVVFDGDTVHAKHSRMVHECGTWLNMQRGVLVWATGTGRWTGKATKGTPGVPDLVGWRIMRVCATAEYTDPHKVFGGGWGGRLHIEPYPDTETKMPQTAYIAQFLAVECKVKPDKLNPAQAAFREEAEAAGVLYVLAEWDGESEDPAADLREKWTA